MLDINCNIHSIQHYDYFPSYLRCNKAKCFEYHMAVFFSGKWHFFYNPVVLLCVCEYINQASAYFDLFVPQVHMYDNHVILHHCLKIRMQCDTAWWFTPWKFQPSPNIKSYRLFQHSASRYKVTRTYIIGSVPHIL